MRLLYLPLLVAVLFIALAGCEKESPATRVVRTPPPVINTAPHASAGPDIWMLLPGSSCTLKGSAFDEEHNVASFLWKQVAGPGAGRIEEPGAAETTVSGLQKGTYAFELIVTDKGNLSDTDIVAVYVHDPASSHHGEVLFNTLTWNCPMGCSLLIQCFSCHVPAGQPFRVYLRRNQAAPWIEVVREDQWTANDLYIYGIHNNNLWVYGNDAGANEKPDVKITF